MTKHPRRTVRQMPKIYGNLQRPPVSFRWFFRTLYLLIWVAVGGGLIYAVGFSGWFAVHKVEVEGTQLSSEAEFKKLVPLGIPIWLVAKDEVTSRILQDHRVESVAIFRGLPDSVRIVVKEKQPQLLWLTATTYYLVDQEGIAFAQYPVDALPPSLSPIRALINKAVKVIDTKAVPVVMGRPVVSPSFNQFVQLTLSQLHQYLPQLEVDRVEVGDTTSDCTVITKAGMHIQFNTLSDSGVQVRNLTRLVQQKKASLNSTVDLRIDRWAYVH